ncbi:MAG: DUF371 domain-containing protein, partial [Pseudonocardia sp.]|nr:DUF371 domain-containing protein [Pseudonocardia sp.]
MEQRLPRMELTGHPALRATHAKTLEFSTDTTATERATCVIGVAATVTGGACAGPVRITIDAGGDVATVDAVANPDWAGGTAIVRRGTDRRTDTFATEATSGAADLPRELVARITDPAVVITVGCARLARRPDGRAGLVLAWSPPGAPPTPRLAAELAAADAVVGEDPAAVALLSGQGHRPVPAAEAEAGLLAGELGRVLVLAGTGLPGGSVPAALRVADRIAVEVAGLPAVLCAVAASPVRGPVLLAGAITAARVGAVLRSVPPQTSLVVSVAAGEVARLLERAAVQRGTVSAAVLDPVAGGPVRWGPVGELRAPRTSGEIVCALDGSAAGPDLGPELTAFVRGLLAEGVSAR